MKIASSSHDLLVLKDRPWFLGGMIWLVGLAATWAALTGKVEDNGLDPLWGQLLVGSIGLGCCLLAWWAFPFQDIRFDRTRRVIVRHIKRVPGGRREVVPLDEFRRAKVGLHHDDGSRLERLELELEDRTWPLEWGYSSASRGPLADAINGWLAGEVPKEGWPYDGARAKKAGDARARIVALLKARRTVPASLSARERPAATAAPPPFVGIPDTRRDLE